MVNDFPNKDNSYTANIFVKEQVKALSEFVEEINVIVPIPRGIELYRKTSYRDYAIGENVHVHFVKYINPLFPIAYSKLRREWIWLEHRALTNFIKKKDIKFDIIHAHYTWPSGAVGVKLKEEYKVPLVITEHTSQTFNRYITTRDPLAREIWQKADIIVRVRKGDIDLFSRVGITPSKIRYIPNGFDGNKFYPIPQEIARRKLNLVEYEKIIINVANMYSRVKGHEYLLRAFSKVAENTSDAFLILVGSGKLLSHLKKLADNLYLGHRVLFAGSKPHDEIPLWMNAADLFVLPSLRESFGVVQIEAMACGVPVVATRNGGSEEIIISEDYGLLCEPANPKELAEKILIALEKEWDREKIRKYAEQFTWENIAKKTLEVYRGVLK